MARYEDTAGNIIITITQCGCGLTGGCEKCRPLIIPKQILIREIREKSHRELGKAWQELASSKTQRFYGEEARSTFSGLQEAQV